VSLAGAAAAKENDIPVFLDIFAADEFTKNTDIKLWYGIKIKSLKRFKKREFGIFYPLF